jgi:hypothetical protein
MCGRIIIIIIIIVKKKHGNGQNAEKLKNTKMIIANYSPNRN